MLLMPILPILAAIKFGTDLIGTISRDKKASKERARYLNDASRLMPEEQEYMRNLQESANTTQDYDGTSQRIIDRTRRQLEQDRARGMQATMAKFGAAGLLDSGAFNEALAGQAAEDRAQLGNLATDLEMRKEESQRKHEQDRLAALGQAAEISRNRWNRYLGGKQIYDRPPQQGNYGGTNDAFKALGQIFGGGAAPGAPGAGAGGVSPSDIGMMGQALSSAGTQAGNLAGTLPGMGNLDPSGVGNINMNDPRFAELIRYYQANFQNKPVG